MLIRPVREADYPPIIAVIDSWWGGRRMADMLPRLFFIHFQNTSFVAEENGAVIGFLIGFVSQTHPTHAYVHFVGVHPDQRQRRIGQRLYTVFFETVKRSGCTVVHAVTSPVNKDSIGFHTRLGFEIEKTDGEVDGVPVMRNYDGEGQDRVVFVKRLA